MGESIQVPPVIEEQPQAPPEETGAEMLVQGMRGQGAPVDPSQYLLEGAPLLRNTDWAQEAQAAREENDKKVDHRGMFGVKGTLRNVLGVLGDAFLVQGGRDPMYAPQRQMEREGDAMAGISQAPRAAVERMTAVNPALAAKMNDSVADAEIARANAERQAAAEAAARHAQGLKIVGGMLGARGLEDEATYRKMQPIIEGLRVKYGLGDEYAIPETYDPNFSTALSTGTIERYKQETLSDADQRIAQGSARVGIAQQNADTASGRAAEQARHNLETESAARARIAKMGGGSSARARADTPLEYFRELEKIAPGNRSAEENAWITNYTGQNRSTRSGRSGRAPATNPSTGRFRRLN
jgi:hypothetical protein